METSSRYGCLVCSIRCYIPYLQYSDKKNKVRKIVVHNLVNF